MKVLGNRNPFNQGVSKRLKNSGLFGEIEINSTDIFTITIFKGTKFIGYIRSISKNNNYAITKQINSSKKFKGYNSACEAIIFLMKSEITVKNLYTFGIQRRSL